jgi:ATP-dependent Clp protease ATP-binding subunit ClpA
MFVTHPIKSSNPMVNVISTSFENSVKTLSRFVPSFNIESIKKKLFPPLSELGKQIQALTAKNSLDPDDTSLLVDGFKSDEFFRIKPMIAKILEKQNAEQTNSILKAIFKAHAFEDTKPLFKKLGSLFTLQKVEQAVRSEFGLFETAQKTAMQLAPAAERNKSLTQNLKEQTLKNTVKYYILNTIDWFIESTLFVLQLTDFTDEDATRLEKQMVAQMRYQALRDNLAVLTGWVVALTLYTGSLLASLAITATMAVSSVIAYALYKSYIKPCPDDVHPGKNRTADATKGNIDAVFGREEVVKKLFDTLENNTKTRARRYPMILGQSGIGKSDLGNSMALFLASPDCPPEWKGKKLFVVSSADLVAGGQHGKMEHLHHIKDVLKGHESDAILFFTEAHVGFQDKTFFLGQEWKTLCDAPGGFPYMIFATTDKEYIEHIAKDAAFARRLEFFDIEPTKNEVTELIISDMVAREAADIFVSKEAIKEVAEIQSQAIEIEGQLINVFENCPQPATSIAITAKVLANARHPWFKEKEKVLQNLNNARSLLEHQLKLNRGVNYLPYSAEGKNLLAQLEKIDQEIATLEQELQHAKGELDQFRALVKKTSDIEEEIQSFSLKVKEGVEKNMPTEEVLKQFLFLLNYLKPAMDECLKDLNGRIAHSSAIIDQTTMRTFIKQEAISYLRKAREKAETRAKSGT